MKKGIWEKEIKKAVNDDFILDCIKKSINILENIKIDKKLIRKNEDRITIGNWYIPIFLHKTGKRAGIYVPYFMKELAIYYDKYKELTEDKGLNRTIINLNDIPYIFNNTGKSSKLIIYFANIYVVYKTVKKSCYDGVHNRAKYYYRKEIKIILLSKRLTKLEFSKNKSFWSQIYDYTKKYDMYFILKEEKYSWLIDGLKESDLLFSPFKKYDYKNPVLFFNNK